MCIRDRLCCDKLSKTSQIRRMTIQLANIELYKFKYGMLLLYVQKIFSRNDLYKLVLSFDNDEFILAQKNKDVSQIYEEYQKYVLHINCKNIKYLNVGSTTEGSTKWKTVEQSRNAKALHACRRRKCTDNKAKDCYNFLGCQVMVQIVYFTHTHTPVSYTHLDVYKRQNQ